MIAHDKPGGSLRLARSGASELLFEYLRELEQRPAERLVARIAAWRLRPLGHRPEHRRAVSSGFEALEGAGHGELFHLHNDEFLFFFPPSAHRTVVGELDRLRTLYSDNGPGYADSEGARVPSYVTFVNPATDMATLVRLADKAAAASCAAATPLTPTPANPPRKATRPITPADLVQLEASLASADLSSMIHRFTVYRLEEGVGALPLFAELTISIADLAHAVMPDVDLLASDWLFDCFTETLDRRMLAMLVGPSGPPVAGCFSVNLNLSTLLSKEFLAFDTAIKPNRRANLVIELKDRDIIDGLNAFVIIRERLQRRGYRFCLDGLAPEMIGVLDLQVLRPDFVKINVPANGNGVDEDLQDRLAQVVAAVGRERVILSRVETAAAVGAGRAAGVILFQGHLMRRLLAEDGARRAMQRLTNALVDGT